MTQIHNSLQTYKCSTINTKHDQELLPGASKVTLVFVLSLNNSEFDDYIDHIYPIKFAFKNTTEKEMSASYLDIYLEIDSKGGLRAKLYDRRYDFDLPIVNFTLFSSNVPAVPA